MPDLTPEPLSEDVCSLSHGCIRLTMPRQMSEADVADAEAFLSLVLKRIRRQADRNEAAQTGGPPCPTP